MKSLCTMTRSPWQSQQCLYIFTTHFNFAVMAIYGDRNTINFFLSPNAISHIFRVHRIQEESFRRQTHPSHFTKWKKATKVAQRIKIRDILSRIWSKLHNNNNQHLEKKSLLGTNEVTCCIISNLLRARRTDREWSVEEKCWKI